jgi:hypothetical protein
MSGGAADITEPALAITSGLAESCGWTPRSRRDFLTRATPEMLRSVPGGCTRVDRRAELLSKAEVVPVIPNLRDLPVLEAKDVGGREADSPPARFEPTP